MDLGIKIKIKMNFISSETNEIPRLSGSCKAL